MPIIFWKPNRTTFSMENNTMKSQYHDKEPKFTVGQKVLVHNEDEICEISQVIDYHSGWRYEFKRPDGGVKTGINGFYEHVFTAVREEKT